MSAAVQSHSFDAIYEAHHGYVGAVLRRLGVSDGDVDDITQEVFVVVHRRLPSFEGRSAIRTWLYAIALRVAANHKRKRRDVDTDMPELVATQSDPEAFAANREASELLFGLLDRLDADKRAVFVLSELRGMTAPEIARITGANTRTVYSRLRAAKDRFSAGLQRAHLRETHLLARQQPKPRRSAAVLGWLGLTPKAAVWGAAALALSVVGVVTVAATSAPAAAPIASDAPSAAIAQPQSSAPRAAPPSPRARAAAPTSAHQPPASTAPSNTPPSRRRTAGPDKPAPTEPSPPTAAPNPELLLLADARKRLSSDPRAALELLDQHVRQFPDSALKPERRKTRLTALCRSEQQPQARGLAIAWSMKPPC